MPDDHRDGGATSLTKKLADAKRSMATLEAVSRATRLEVERWQEQTEMMQRQSDAVQELEDQISALQTAVSLHQQSSRSRDAWSALGKALL